MQDTHTPPPAAAVMQMVMGRFVSHAIGTAAELGVADVLAKGPKSSVDIAKEVGADADATHRLLRMLASVGVFVEAEPGRFANTPLSETLRSDHPMSVRPMALFFNHPVHIEAWVELPYSVRTGKPAFEHVHGEPPFPYVQKHPEIGKIFNDAMTSLSAQWAGLVTASYDFSKIGTLVDVGGGHGKLLTMILAKHPSIKGILFDLPPVVEGAKPVIEAAGTASRCQIVGGSFFESVPQGGDAYLMKSIVHDWNDEDAKRILKTIHAASRPGTRLLLVESVIRPGNNPDLGKFIDIEMLVVTSGGRERTEAEYARLMEATGFKFDRVVTTQGPACIIEGTRI